MKRTVLLMTMIAFVAVLIGGQATAATTQSSAIETNKSPVFKLPKGAKLLTEISLSDDDLLKVIKEAIPAFLQGFSASLGESETTVETSNGCVSGFKVALGSSDLNEVFESIKGIKAFRFETFVPPTNSNVDELLGFFEAQVPASEGWNRVFYSTEVITKPEVLVAIYSQNNQRYMAIGLDSTKEVDVVASLEGSIDVPRLAQLIGKWVAPIAAMIGAADGDDNSADEDAASTTITTTTTTTSEDDGSEDN